MIVVLKGIVTEKFTSEKGNTYLTFVDQEMGGMVKITMKGCTEVDIRPGEALTVEAEVKGSMYQGRQSLEYIKGTITR